MQQTMRMVRNAPGARALLLAGVLALAPSLASAVPVLQLDIAGGSYDPVEEIVFTDADSFTVYAYLKAGASLTDTYYLSVALAPQVSTAGSFGSVSVNGTSYGATGDMVFGVPPIEGGVATFDAGDLPKHGVYETYFFEVSFQFDAANVSGVYDTAETPGLGPIAGSGLYFAAFEIDRSALDPELELRFDLFSKGPGRCNGPPSAVCSDVDVALFAPPSHTAGTVPAIPEPSAALVFALGAVAVRYAGRRPH